MARPGTRQALALLEEIADKHDVNTLILRSPFKHRRAIMAKKDFCRQAKAAGIPYLTMAQVLNLTHTTVLYHAKPEMQERKKLTRTVRWMHRETLEGYG